MMVGRMMVGGVRERVRERGRGMNYLQRRLVPQALLGARLLHLSQELRRGLMAERAGAVALGAGLVGMPSRGSGLLGGRACA